MENVFTCVPLEAASIETTAVLKVVIAYEDFTTGQQAKQTLDRMAGHLGSGWHCVKQMWKFDVLELPKLRELAVDDAVLADIIVVAAQPAHELPPGVRSWIEMWLGKHSQSVALVALFDPAETPLENRVRPLLAEAARRGGMNFIPGPEFSGAEVRLSKNWLEENADTAGSVHARERLAAELQRNFAGFN